MILNKHSFLDLSTRGTATLGDFQGPIPALALWFHEEAHFREPALRLEKSSAFVSHVSTQLPVFLAEGSLRKQRKWTGIFTLLICRGG